MANWEDLILRATENSVGAGRTLMEQLLERGPPPASFVCSSLMVLEGATQRLKEQIGRIPPETVMGAFDDQESLDFLPNRVFSARQNEGGIGVASLRATRGTASRQDDAARANHGAIPVDPARRRRALARVPAVKSDLRLAARVSDLW